MTSTNPTPAATDPTPAKPKKTGVPCGCGCKETTNPGRLFRQGHDARVPLNAKCTHGDCKATAGFAVGKVPACKAHLASVVTDQAGSGRVSVRQLPKAS